MLNRQNETAMKSEILSKININEISNEFRSLNIFDKRKMIEEFEFLIDLTKESFNKVLKANAFFLFVLLYTIVVNSPLLIVALPLIVSAYLTIITIKELRELNLYKTQLNKLNSIINE